jgi:hypothetical protein
MPNEQGQNIGNRIAPKNIRGIQFGLCGKRSVYAAMKRRRERKAHRHDAEPWTLTDDESLGFSVAIAS